MGMSPNTPLPDVAVSPDKLQPGPIRIVGAVRPLPSSTGNQCTRIFVPSNEVRSQSVGVPAIGVATTGWAGGPRWQECTAATATSGPAKVEVGAADDEQAAS